MSDFAGVLGYLRAFVIVVAGLLAFVYAAGGYADFLALSGEGLPQDRMGYCRAKSGSELYRIPDTVEIIPDKPGAYAGPILWDYYVGPDPDGQAAGECWPRASDEYARFYGIDAWERPTPSDPPPASAPGFYDAWQEAFREGSGAGASWHWTPGPDGERISHPAFRSRAVEGLIPVAGRWIALGLMLAVFAVYGLYEAVYRG